ncbi:MAG: DUF1553 domain-containing protein [Verrucomicrobiota bacterium]|nr:DUF1553 domain-containing protein [Verrucomicrobiota bacterium]
MNSHRIFLVCLFLASPFTVLENSGEDAAQLFTQKIGPLLESRCVSCHGPDKQKAGLRLDSREAAMKGGEGGPSLVPNDPDKSLLLQAVMHSKPDLEMPPKEKLTPRDIELLTLWIKAGAPWPVTKSEGITVSAGLGEYVGDAWSDKRNPIHQIWGGKRLDLWSLKPIRRVDPPRNNGRWARNAIDHFILHRLQSANLQPLPEADKRVLARRVYLDLTGLPPSFEQMQAFLSDKRSDAYERLVDQLLTSPRYGEHWARQWLDVVRYSDSNGFDWDEYRKDAWRYRDYVIRSFNSDKPFDQFVREQLAGDELIDGPPTSPKEQDLLIATGYLRVGPQDNSAPLFNEQARARAELLADLTETTSGAFLGLTMSCCRCHDHKYDPLSQADHFRLRAFFEQVKYADDLPLDLKEEQAVIRAHNAQLEEVLKDLTAKRSALLTPKEEELKAELIAMLSAEEAEILKQSKEGADAELKKKIEAVEKKVTPAEETVIAALPREQAKALEELKQEIEATKKRKRSFTVGLLMTDAEGIPPATKILFQGDHKQERNPVLPGFISAIDPNPAIIRKPVNSKTSGRRLTLAELIISPDNPLTARVLVNRIWQGHFGRGFVATPNDFGLAGAEPSHPELLDWLASELMARGWSIKQLHRLIVTSATYRQSSTAPGKVIAKGVASDSENQLLWRQTFRRMSAEQLRDSALFVSGLLQEKAGGPPVWPELPAEVLQANPAFLDDNAEKTKGWYPSPPGERNVRSIYLVQKRTVRVPLLETFDLPDNSTSCARRNESVVAPQALSLLNSPFAVETATAFAARVEREAGSLPKNQVQRVFEIAFQRSPKIQELETCTQFLQQRSLAELCRSVLNLNEFVYID